MGHRKEHRVTRTQFFGVSARDFITVKNVYLCCLSIHSAPICFKSHPQASEHRQYCLINDDNNQTSVWHPVLLGGPITETDNLHTSFYPFPLPTFNVSCPFRYLTLFLTFDTSASLFVFFPYFPLHPNPPALCSQKGVNNVSYQCRLLVLLERDEREMDRKLREEAEEVRRDERGRERKAGSEKEEKRLRQKAWIAEISLDLCLALWMRLLINVLTLLHSDWLAGWVTIKQIDRLTSWLTG